MIDLRSFVSGSWVTGNEPFATLVDPATEEPLARTSTNGLDFGAALAYARETGGPALRALSFAERGALLKAWSKALYEKRDELIGLAMKNGGNTRGDAKFDVDGAIATLAHYAELGAQLGSLHALRDGEPVQLGRTARYAGIHLWTPRDGVAVHINAFNFPAWGTAEKAACALLAGMPIISKPATSTALVAFRLAEIGAAILPAGTFSFICGSSGDLLDRLGPQDVVAFTGSSQTAAKLRPGLGKQGVRFNVEADSLNAALLGPDVSPGSASWDLFVQDTARDMTQKTGQKCTAVRRIFTPSTRLGEVREALVERLAAIRVGDTSRPDVTMGPVSTADQLRDVRAGIARLARESEVAFGGDGSVQADAPAGKGYFLSPVLFVAGPNARTMHHDEVFGPVATLCGYERDPDSVQLVRRGGGGLVCSVYSDDRDFLRRAVLGIAPYHGRIYLGSEKIAGQTMGPGTVLPQLLHGGPGHAGGGEELGGLRGLQLYSQRVAIQGDRALLDAIAPALQPSGPVA